MATRLTAEACLLVQKQFIFLKFEANDFYFSKKILSNLDVFVPKNINVDLVVNE